MMIKNMIEKEKSLMANECKWLYSIYYCFTNIKEIIIILGMVNPIAFPTFLCIQRPSDPVGASTTDACAPAAVGNLACRWCNQQSNYDVYTLW